MESSECTINAVLTASICTAELAVIQSKMRELNFPLMESLEQPELDQSVASVTSSLCDITIHLYTGRRESLFQRG